MILNILCACAVSLLGTGSKKANLLFVTTVLIEDGISVIGEYAFYNDTSVQVISVPNSVNTIGQYAFYNCNSIKEINIPNGVTAIRSHTFFGCASLENIVTPNSVTLIEDCAFYGCVEAKNLTISNNCKSIGDNAFYNCKSITTLIIPSSVTKIGSYAFRSCILITELDFSDNVDDIGECAFYDCNALKIVRLGKRVTELKDRMFYGCVNLTDLYVNAPLSFIDELAFYGAEDVTIHCGRDDYMIAFFEENGLNYVIDESLIYEYKIVFKDSDGNILSSALYKYGDTVVVPEAPAKAADLTYIYIFKDWGRAVSSVGGNAEYIATYTSVYIDYTIIFKNYDGTIISSQTYHFGDIIEVPTNPTKVADNTYTYTFKGWNKAVVNCAGNAEYTAEYTPVHIEYTVIFKNENGTVLSEKQYHFGDTIEVPAQPSKAADLTYTYAFKSWDKAVIACAGDAEYVAVYTPTYIEYTIRFLNEDGSVLSEKQYHYGDVVTLPPTPAKDADKTYTYTFKGWNEAVVNCAGNAEYTATYTPVFIEYTVTFKDMDGNVLTSKQYHYGAVVTVPEAPLVNGYKFKQWSPSVNAVTGNKEYTAQYDKQCVVKVTGGSVNNASSATLTEGDVVIAKANDAQAGMRFKGWSIDNGATIISQDNEYSFFANEDVELVAVYERIPNRVKTSGGTIAITIVCSVAATTAVAVTIVLVSKKKHVSK